MNVVIILINVVVADESVVSNPGYWWYLNVKKFTDETTFHGLKYVFEDSKYFLRK